MSAIPILIIPDLEVMRVTMVAEGAVIRTLKEEQGAATMGPVAAAAESEGALGLLPHRQHPLPALPPLHLQEKILWALWTLKWKTNQLFRRISALSLFRS
mmetsp:Transcript_121521/g.350841  ORF Transcript_121521/g.350841 Transcript_121521/m.350841 type:complete len:100 (+) Transcript_121521:261-560(+)